MLPQMGNQRPVPRWVQAFMVLGVLFGVYLWCGVLAMLVGGSGVHDLPLEVAMLNTDYCHSAANALESYLAERGYAATNERPNGTFSGSSSPIYERWYQPSNHSPMYITVCYWDGGHMDVRVTWETTGWRLNRDRLNAEGAALEQDLQAWWKKYKASHPGQTRWEPSK
jgi:hypothetical protein